SAGTTRGIPISANSAHSSRDFCRRCEERTSTETSNNGRKFSLATSRDIQRAIVSGDTSAIVIVQEPPPIIENPLNSLATIAQCRDLFFKQSAKNIWTQPG